MAARTALDILATLGSPHMPDAGIRFALLSRPNHIASKPVAFASIDQLAASVHRRRKGRALWMVDAKLLFEGEDQPRQGVSVWTVGLDGGAGEFIGWCWIDGRQRGALEAALAAHTPNTQAIRRAA